MNYFVYISEISLKMRAGSVAPALHFANEKVIRFQLCILMIGHNLDVRSHDVGFNHVFETFFNIYSFCIMFLYNFIDIIFSFEIKLLDGLDLSSL